MSKFTPYQHSDDAGDSDSRVSGLSFSQMLAAGVASLAAAVVTSRFGVAGTVLGAALTTMIITGGSTIIKSYLETLHKRVQSVPQRIREGRTRYVQTHTRDEYLDEQSEQTHVDEPRTGQDIPRAAASERREGSEVPGGMVVYGRGRGGDGQGFFGRLRASLGWFSGLPGSRKRNVLLGAAVPTVVVFFVAMSAITGVEVISGRTLSCLTSGSCQTAAPGSTSGTSNTTFGEIASLSNDSSGDSELVRPAGDQNDGQSIVPGRDSSGGQSGQEGGGSGFFGQPSGSDSGAGGSSGGSGPGVPSDSSGTGTPSGDQQEVVPSDPSGSGSSSGAVQEQPVPQQGQPSGAEQVPTQ